MRSYTTTQMLAHLVAFDTTSRNANLPLITFVEDRPGHDRRYALDTRKIRDELGWQPRERFEDGIRQTISWYLDHPEWVANIMSGDYQKWLEVNYGAREIGNRK